MSVSQEGFLDFFKKNHKVLIDTDNEKVSLAESGSDNIFIVYKYKPDGVFKDLYYKTTAGNLNPVQRAIHIANFLNSKSNEINKMVNLVTSNSDYLNNLTEKLKSNVEKAGGDLYNYDDIEYEFEELFNRNSRYKKFEDNIADLSLSEYDKVLYSDIKPTKKFVTPGLTPDDVKIYHRQIELLKQNFSKIDSNLYLTGDEWFSYLSDESTMAIADGDFGINMYTLEDILKTIRSLIAGKDVKSYLNVSKVTTESFSESTSYLESLGLSLGVENIDVGINEITDEYDEDIIVGNQGPIEEITILQNNLTSATEAQIVLESLVSKLKDGLDNQSKPFVAITLQQFKEYGSVEVISTETAKQLLSNLGKKIIEWLKAIWKKIVNLSKYIKTKLFNVFDRLRKIFTRHKSTPVPKDFGNKRTPTGTIPVKNISVLIDNDSSNKVLSDTIGYNNFRTVTRNLKTLLDASLLCCNKTLVKIRPLLANFDDIENGGTFRPEYLNDEKVFNFGCLKLITTVNDDTGYVNVSLHSELSIVDKEAEVAMYPVTAKNIVPFEFDKYKEEFELISYSIRRLENDRRITRAIKYFEENGDLSSAKSIYLKYITTACLSLSTLIVDVLNIVNVYTVYLEESDKYNSSDVA